MLNMSPIFITFLSFLSLSLGFLIQSPGQFENCHLTGLCPRPRDGAGQNRFSEPSLMKIARPMPMARPMPRPILRQISRPIMPEIRAKIIDRTELEEPSDIWHLKQEPFCGQSGPQQTSRIVGGSKAKLGQFPWQAQILTVKPPNDTPIFTCGGSLISDELIVTAAHCIHYTDPER